MELVTQSERSVTKSDKQRVTQKQKNANDKQWYKDKADLLDHRSRGSNNFWFDGKSSFHRKKVNYDLFNNIINENDFKYVCKPFGDTGELPATLTNRDIISGKIKVLLGMEMKMPFSWKVVAVNEEATTRREQEESKRIRDFVIGQVMTPIKLQIEKQLREQQKGKELTPEEEQQLQQEIQSQTQSQTPSEVRKYMTREHQDPAEVLAHQLLEYLIQTQKVNDKFNKGWKHSMLSGEEIYWVGIVNGEPTLRVVNPLYFEYDKSPDTDEIENGEWASYEMRMSRSEVIANFGSELTEDEIDRIYDTGTHSGSPISSESFTFDETTADNSDTIRVVHFTFKGLRKIGFLAYKDQKQEIQLDIVDENYKLDKEAGDISLEWEWIPEAHEVYKILNDIYVHARPVPGQHKDLDNLYTCTLPYIGAACDSLNSVTTSPMDRMKAYQYYYNIILYRIELLMASDKGKIMAVNIGSIPKSSGIDINKFMYFLEANKIAWFNPQEEGNKSMGDVTNMVKEVDMSLVSDIWKYVQLAQYIEQKTGSSIGVTPQMEAQIAAGEAVTNTRQNLVQSSHIIQPYFELHNIVKANVLTHLLEIAKVAYSTGRPRKLSYILDDMSLRTLYVDQDLLSMASYGLFVANSSKAHDAKEAVNTLGQAAMQNQQADLADIIKVIRSESITEAEELLEAARSRKNEEINNIEKQKLQMQDQMDQRASARLEQQHQFKMEEIELSEKLKTEREIQKQTILSMGFNEDKDEDDDGTPDVLEIAKFGVDADIKSKQLDLAREEFEHKKKYDREKLTLDDKKLRLQAKKDRQRPKS